MRALTFGALVVAFLGLVSASPVAHSSSPGESLAARDFEAACGRPESRRYCSGTNQTSDDRFVCGDSRLGPKVLPKTRPLRPLVFDYDRFGGLCPGAFLAKWTDATGAYVYPPQNGFQLNVAGQPIEGSQTLTVGMRLDRFGSEYGQFLAPALSPYSQRALPPSSLNTPADGTAFNYHLYEVTKEFVVLSGPIAQWFGQGGQGTQYYSSNNVMTLLSGGYLQRVDVSDY